MPTITLETEDKQTSKPEAVSTSVPSTENSPPVIFGSPDKKDLKTNLLEIEIVDQSQRSQPIKAKKPPRKIKFFARIKASFHSFRNKKKLFVSTVIIFGLTVGLAFIGASGWLFKTQVPFDGNAVMSLTTPSTSPEAGTIIPIHVHLDTAGDKLFAATVIVSYDKRFLAPVDADDTTEEIDALSPIFPKQSFSIKEPDESTNGIDRNHVAVSLNQTSIDEIEPLDSDILTINFEVLSDTPSTTLILETIEHDTGRTVATRLKNPDDAAYTDNDEVRQINILKETNDLILNISPSTGNQECDNGILEEDEVCDGTNFGGATCSSKTAGTMPYGSLSCLSSCSIISTDSCTDTEVSPPPTSSTPIPTIPTPTPSGAVVDVSASASPSSVKGSDNIKVKFLIESKNGESTITLSSSARNGVVRGGKGTTMRYESDYEVDILAPENVSGSFTDDGITLKNIPADTPINLVVRASVDGSELTGDDRETLRDTITVSGTSSGNATVRVTVRSKTSEPDPTSIPPTNIPPTYIPPTNIPPTYIPPTSNPNGNGGNTSGGSTTGGSTTGSNNTGGSTTGGSTSGGSTTGGSTSNSSGRPFADVSPDHPAAVAISKLKNIGALDGYDPNHFGPDNSLTRAELAKILTLATKTELVTAEQNIPDSNPNVFQNNPDYAEFYPSIQTVVAKNWVSLTDQTKYSPWIAAAKPVAFSAIRSATGSTVPRGGGSITRAEFCIELVKALGI